MKWWRNIKDLVLSFYYPSGKFFLVSFPNSGRTWLLYMLKNIMKELGKEDFHIESTHDHSEIIIENGTRPDPNFIFTFTSRFRYIRSKVIFLSRDPRDVITSNFHQVTNRSKNPFKFNSISEFIMHEIYGFKRVIHFFNLWSINRDKPKDFLLIKYENLLEEGIDELQKLMLFFNLNVPQELIRRVYNNSHADKMRKKEKDNQLEGFSNFGKAANKLKVRVAKKGSYLLELTQEDIDFCNSEMKNLSDYFGYKI